jgi:hypothetical protein
MKSEKQILVIINNMLKRATLAKTTYRDNIQGAFEVFVANYNGALNKNKTPFINIIRALSGSDKTAFNNYVKACTNITAVRVDKDGKVTIAFNNITDKENPLQYDNDYIDSHKWYDDIAKKDNKVEFNNDSFLKQLKTLLTRANNNNIDKAFIKESLTNTINSL